MSASQVVSLEISVENPIVSASYNIDVFSYSTEYQAKIDEGSGQITIGTICNIFGSSLTNPFIKMDHQNILHHIH